MISRNIKNIIDIQRNGKRVLNVVRNGEVLHYYIPDSYVELEYIQNDEIIVTNNNYTKLYFDYYPTKDTSYYLDCCWRETNHDDVFIGINNTRTWHDSYNINQNSVSTSNGIIAFSYFSATETGNYASTGGKGLFTSGSRYTLTANKGNFLIEDENGSIVTSANLRNTYHDTYDDGSRRLLLGQCLGKIYKCVVKTNDIVSIHAIPVRRLGDAICGLYDTINQKFYPSETQVQFKGGPVKTVKNEFLTGNSWEKVTNMQWSKNSSYSRYKKTFIIDMVNKPYANTSHTKVLRTATSGVDEINGYGAAMTPPTYIDFQRLLFTNTNTGNILLQNVNPNWNIIKTVNAETNSFETDNQNLYFANKNSIEVVLTGNKKGNTNNVSVAKSSIARIVHLPYLEFTGEETSVINIGSIEITKDTRFKIRYEKHPVRSFDPIFGYGTHKTHACYLLPDSKNDANTESRIFFKNGDVEGSWFNTTNINYPSGTIDIQNNTVEFDGVRVKVARRGTDNQSDTWSDFALGARFNASLTNIYYWIGTINYFRLERKNSLYRHYLSAIMILNDGNYYLGFFESVEQIFYQCDSKTKPAYFGSSLNDDWSNIVDINGNTGVYSKVIDIIHTGNWRDNQVWNDSKIWSDTGSVTK